MHEHRIAVRARQYICNMFITKYGNITQCVLLHRYCVELTTFIMRSSKHVRACPEYAWWKKCLLHHIPTSGNMEGAGGRRSYSQIISRETYIALVASAFYRRSKYFTTTALHTIVIQPADSNARYDACVATVHFIVMQLLKGQSHSIR